MNSTVWKDNLREIKQSFPRFLSIFAIISLGVAFFVGIKATGPSMVETSARYFEKYQMPDGTILSTSGITDEDLDILSDIHGVSWLPMKSFDSSLKPGTETAKIFTHDYQQNKNFFKVVEGRMPEKTNEIALDSALLGVISQGASEPFKIGDTITLEQPSSYDADNENVSDEKNSLTIQGPHLLEQEFEIVGFVESPLYFERISRGPGTVSMFAVIPEENVAGDIYSEVYYWVDEAAAYDAYSEEYDATTLASKLAIEESLNGQPLARLNEMRKDLNELLRDGRQEIADAYQEIYNGSRLLEEGRQEIATGWLEYDDGQVKITEAEREIFSGEAELEKGQAELQAGWLEFYANQNLLWENELAYQSGLEEYNVALAAFQAGIAEGEATLIAAEAELASAYQELEAGRQQLIEGQAQIDAGRAQIAAARQQIIDELIGQIPEGLDSPEAILAYLEEMGISVSDLIENLENQLETLPTQIETLIEELQNVEAEITLLEEENENLRVEQAALENELELLAPVLAEQQDALVTAETSLTNMQLHLQSLQDQLATTPPTLTDEAGNESPNPSYSELQIEISSLESEISAQSLIVADLQSTVTASATEYSRLEAELTAKKEEIAANELEIENLRQTQLDTIAELDILQDAFEDVDIEKIQAEIERLLASREEIEAQLQQLIEAIEAIQAAEAELDLAQAELDAGWLEYYDGLAQYNAGLVEVNAGWATLEEERANGQSQLDAAALELQEGRLALDDAYAQLEEGRLTLLNADAELVNGLAELNAGRIELLHAKRLAYEGYWELRDGEQELSEKQMEFADEAASARLELAEAETDLADAEAELADLEGPIYYVNGRDSNQAYESLYENADKINIISNIFPVFFFAIAVLVTFTTVKRMGSEQRNYMGTMKQMGYPTHVILSKFVTYAGVASFAGVLFGIWVGYAVFPSVIINAYNMMYYFDEKIILTSHAVNLVVALIALSCAIVPAIVTPLNILRTQPAMLLQPEPPKSGKKILFERIPWLWKALSFKRKMTIRNLLRYKGRNSMTLFGVAGCTMLILTGFGISDTISGIVDQQMTVIQTFNSMVYLQDNQTAEDVEAFSQELLASGEVEKIVPVYTTQLNTDDSEKLDQPISVVVPMVDSDTLSEFVSLHRRSAPETQLDLKTSGPVLTERMSEYLGLGEGDTIQLKDDTEQLYDFEIGAISEYYIGHNLYLSPDEYEKVFFEEASANAFYVKYVDGIDSLQLENSLASDDRVLTLINLETIAEQAGQSLGSLDIITVVLIVSAAGLAFVVLYNLTNINIAERMRELSTIKVLGFYNTEVSMYIFEEILVLTSIGSVIGLGLGNVLTSFLMKMMQPNNLLFNPHIHWDSYLISAALTFAFSSIVMLFMHKKLRNIDMVEALKAVE